MLDSECQARSFRLCEQRFEFSNTCCSVHELNGEGGFFGHGDTFENEEQRRRLTQPLYSGAGGCVLRAEQDGGIDREHDTG